MFTPGKTTELLPRFSTVAGEMGAADAERDLRSPTALWDFWSLSPESLHQVTILMSDRGLPVCPRFINGYGSHGQLLELQRRAILGEVSFQDPPGAPAPDE